MFDALVADVGPGISSALPQGARRDTATRQELAKALLTWYYRNGGKHQLLMKLGWSPPLWQHYRGNPYDADAITQHLCAHLVMVDIYQLYEVVVGRPLEKDYGFLRGAAGDLIQTVSASMPAFTQLSARIARPEHPLWNET